MVDFVREICILHLCIKIMISLQFNDSIVFLLALLEEVARGGCAEEKDDSTTDSNTDNCTRAQCARLVHAIHILVCLCVQLKLATEVMTTAELC